MASELPGTPGETPGGRSDLPAVRVGDAERRAVVDRLSAALAEGRLELAEFEERSAAAYAARTAGELAPLTADLPAPSPPPAPRRSGRSGVRLTKDEREWVKVSFVLTVIWLIINVARGELSFFWPVFPIGIWGAVLVAERIGRGLR